MDPVQALILKLMESRAGQDRAALQPTSDPGMQGPMPQPGGAQAPGQSPEDLIAQLLGGMQGGGPPTR